VFLNTPLENNIPESLGKIAVFTEPARSQSKTQMGLPLAMFLSPRSCQRLSKCTSVIDVYLHFVVRTKAHRDRLSSLSPSQGPVHPHTPFLFLYRTQTRPQAREPEGLLVVFLFIPKGFRGILSLFSIKGMPFHDGMGHYTGRALIGPRPP